MWSVTLAVLTLAGVSVGHTATACRVVNGGFEDGAAGWENAPQVVSVEPHGGAHALVLAKGYVFQSPSALIPVAPGHDYRLKIWIRTDGCESNGVGVCAMWRAQDRKTLAGHGWIEGTAPSFVMDQGQSPVLAVTGGTHAWQEFTVVIPALQLPAEARFLHLYLRHDLQKKSTGAAWFDDLTAEELPAGSLAPLVIVRNGDFEHGKAGWWGEGKWDVVPAAGVGGSAALRVDDGYACQDKRPVTGGKNYRISMQIKSEGAQEGSAFVQLSYRGQGMKPTWFGPLKAGTGDAALFVAGGTQAWKEFSDLVTAPPAATEILIYLRKQGGAGAAFYDNVKIEPTDEKVPTAADKRQAELAKELLQPAVTGSDVAGVLAAAVAASSKASPAKLMLAEDGKALFRIHVGSKAEVVTLGAVKELASYLNQITGAEFAPISHDANPQGGPLIVVGRETELTAKLCPDIPYDKLGRDGFVIRTVGPNLVIAGAMPCGTLFGVNWLLDHKLGVKWLSPGYTLIPSAKTLQVAPINALQAPHFAFREILSWEGSDRLFRLHNLASGESHGPSFAATPPEIDCSLHDWMAKDGYGNFFELLPQKTYGKSHPGWYAGGQMAMMNKDMRAELARVIADRMKAHPDYKSIWFEVHDMDWGWDMDSASQAFAAKHGGHPSAPRLDMMIDVANRVREVLPGARFAFNAYHWSFTPPEGITVPDYILVFPMTIHVDYSTALNKGRNEKLGQDIAGWTKIAKTVQIWDHIANWSGYIQPEPNIYPIGASIRWLGTLPNVRGYMAEGCWETPASEFSALRAWMMMRLLWDPTLEVKPLVEEFCRGYYGAAGPIIVAYIDLEHAALARSGDVIAEKTQVDLKMYDLGFLTRADSLFNDAEAAVAGNETLLAHVREARMPVDFVILVRRKDCADEAVQRGIAWQPDTSNRMARLTQTIEACKLRSYRQGQQKGELDELLAVERRTPEPNPMVRNLARTDWVELQELSLNRYSTARIVADSAASDGAAIRMIGNDATWAMQLKPDKLPHEGTWDVWADVRVEAEAGHDAEPGVNVGFSPPMNRFTTAKIGDLNDGKYHLVKVPGGPFRFENDHGKSIYVQAAAKPYITYVYLDRIIAIRHKP